MFGLNNYKKISLEEQMLQLEDIGITVKADISKDYFLEQFSREKYENTPFLFLLIEMGGEAYINNDFVRVSEDIWHFDMECIEDEDKYTELTYTLLSLTKNKIVIENLSSYVDQENKKAGISFTIDNKEYDWELNYNFDWFDIDLIHRFSEVCEDLNLEERFIFLNLGQGCLVGFLTPNDLIKLNKLLKNDKFQFVI